MLPRPIVPNNRKPALSSAWPRVGSARIPIVTAAEAGASSCSQKLTNKARIIASQTRMAKLHELTGIFATVNGCCAIVATKVSPSSKLRMPCHSSSALVSRHVDRGDEAVATSTDVNDEPTSVPTVAQRASQRRHVDREIGGVDEKLGPNASSQVLPADKLASPFKQSNQDLQGTASERHGLLALQQKKLRRQQTKRSE